VSYVIPTLLNYTTGSVVVIDVKGELFVTTAAAREALGQKVYVIDPFHVCTAPGRGDCYKRLLEIRPDDPRLVDDARALAEAIVRRPPEGDKDPHWNNSAVILLTAMIVATVLFMKPEDRNLSTVREMMTDPALFKEVVRRLQAHGGIPARLGNQLARQQESEKEMASVTSTANAHAGFADSRLVADALATSTLSGDALLQPGTTLYVVLPIDQLEAQRNYLRLVMSSLIRHVTRHGVRNGGELLFLLDECASFGAGLEALEQALQLGRGRGLRVWTFWQTVEQAQAAFKGKPNLVADNSDAQIYFGVNSYPTADLVSKSLGAWTMTVESANETASRSRPSGGSQAHDSRSVSHSETRSYSEVSRALMLPSEVMQLSGEFLIAFVRGVPPILARRIKWYADPLFRRGVLRRTPLAWWLLLASALALTAWGLSAH
jgi:type IV secretion system protein VirD4